MCGIVGATGDQGSWVKEATRCLRHRGPDRQAWHRDAQVQLGHARLAVVDLTSAADQPMFSDDRSLALVFNGEFYDFRAHRRRLRRQGHRFRTRSDAEIILKLSQVEGDRFLEKINGPFAIGIWDFRRRSLLLARDRLGEKPLYYTSLADGNLLFASEIKSLLRHPKVSAQLDEAALDEYLTYFYVPAPRTVFRGIR